MQCAMEETNARGTSPGADDVGRRATFRLDLYAVDDGWIGHVRHVLSRDHATFDVDDGPALMAFIIAHLPQPERPPVRPVPSPDGPAGTPGVGVPCPSLAVTWSVASVSGCRTSQLARGEAFEVRYGPAGTPPGDAGGWSHGSIELHAHRIGGSGSMPVATGLWSPARASEGGAFRGLCELGAGLHLLRLLVRGMDRNGRTVGVAVSPVEATVMVI